MKHVFTTISAVLLAGSLCASAASAMPRLDSGAAAPTPATITQARLVCNYRRCFRTGYYRPYYRTYGYYRPYYYRPHLGIGIGPFGVGVF